MGHYFQLILVVLAAGGINAFPFRNDLQRRNLHDVLESTARKAETIGKAAFNYFVPSNLKSGLAAVKPLLKRSVKRSAFAVPQPGSYQLPYRNEMLGSPLYYNNWQYAYWQNPNSYWRTPVARSVIPAPFYPQYFQQQYYYPNELQTRTLQNYPTYTAEAEKDDGAAKESLKEFQNLVSKVDSAMVSYTDKTGVTLNEDLQGVGSVKKDVASNSQKRSQTPKEMQKEGLKVITDTFTDFVCGDNC